MKFLETKQSLWENTQKLGDFVGRESEFDAVFYVGGHGRELSFWSLKTPSALTYGLSDVRSRE